MPITLKDVAQRAGVTPTAVSHVLHGRASGVRVSAPTAERIRAAATELGYRLNLQARQLREGKTLTIGVLHGVGFARPLFTAGGSLYFSSLMDGIVEGAFRHGYSVTLCPRLLGDDPETALNDGRFDGFLWYSTLPNEASQRLIRGCNRPLVLLHATARDFEGRFPTVICDNAGGMGQAVDHLLELGHRRIAFAYQHRYTYAEVLLRLDAWREAMAARGLASPIEDAWLLDDAAENLADHLGSATAVIAHNEGFASDLMAQAQKLGLSLPADLSVVGFDSTSYCDAVRPRLTAVRQPLALLGERAVELLIERMRHDSPLVSHLVLPCGFDVRESTSRPAQG